MSFEEDATWEEEDATWEEEDAKIMKKQSKITKMMIRVYKDPMRVSISEYLSYYPKNQHESKMEDYSQMVTDYYERREHAERLHQNRTHRETRMSQANYARKVEQNNIDRRDDTINQVLLTLIGIPVIIGVIALIVGIIQRIFN